MLSEYFLASGGQKALAFVEIDVLINSIMMVAASFLKADRASFIIYILLHFCLYKFYNLH